MTHTEPQSAMTAALFSSHEVLTTTHRVADLQPWTGNPRSDVNSGSVDDLKIALTEQGRYLHDVSVLVRDGQHYVFIGGRRLRAARELLADGAINETFELNVKLYPSISDADALHLANQENINREDMNVTDTLTYLLSQRDMGTPELARRTGMSSAAIESLFLVNDTGDEVITAALRERKIEPQLAAMLCSLPEQHREHSLKQALEGTLNRQQLLHKLKYTGITMEVALFDHSLYTGRLDNAFGLLGFGGTRIAKDEDSREQWLNLQRDAAEIKASEHAQTQKYEGGGMAVIAENGEFVTRGFRYTSDRRVGRVLALVNPHTGVVTYTYGVVPAGAPTTGPSEKPKFEPTDKAKAAARDSVTRHVQRSLNALDGEQQERYALALTIAQRITGRNFLNGTDHTVLTLEVPGLATAYAEGAAASLSRDRICLKHLLTLDTDVLRDLHTKVILRSFAYRGANAAEIISAVIELTGAASVVPMDENFLKSLSASEIKGLIELMPVKPETKSQTRSSLIKAILAVAPANASANFQPPTHVLPGHKDTLSRYEVTVDASTVAVTVQPDAHATTEPVEAPPVEAAPVDAQPVEAAQVDAEPVEAAQVDAEPVEAAPVDAQPVEAAQVDAEPVEAAQVDAEPVEAAQVDADPVEAAQVDAEPVDMEITGCAACGNTREVWDEELCDTVPCVACATGGIRA